ncbi:MAG: PhoH family protein [Salibacteraceae bacterium]|nr:PhoH family protein [Salibacteraceae bacterium]MDP4686543.1 PhoH family protein [Salibacteraceae bacterium]MDP4845048.1 PhoH family protein [Salibacteraceae bacterium]MDP4935644.1 PhoH family protein [Salibacteraceae bacterium]MDP4964714.1 PhoH family protein [Salibacteraceae bacterium]
MHEIIIQFDDIHPVDILGVNNANLQVLRKHFTALKIIARGDQLKVLGPEEDLEKFDKKWKELIHFLNEFNRLSESDVRSLVNSNNNEIKSDASLLLYGNNGKVIKARTPNQQLMVESCAQNDMVFAIGPAGTGKTYTAVALAVKALREKQVQRIILTRPAVEAGESLGFLPGDLKDKLDPYLRPLYDALLDMIPHDKLTKFMERSVIEIAPLAFMRGRTLGNAFVILDEAQNATENQMKMFLTRMGRDAKFMITGDVSQVDLPRHIKSGLLQSINILDGVKGIGMIKLDKRDVIRHKLVESIIDRYESLPQNDK